MKVTHSSPCTPARDVRQPTGVAVCSAVRASKPPNQKETENSPPSTNQARNQKLKLKDIHFLSLFSFVVFLEVRRLRGWAGPRNRYFLQSRGGQGQGRPSRRLGFGASQGSDFHPHLGTLFLGNYWKRGGGHLPMRGSSVFSRKGGPVTTAGRWGPSAPCLPAAARLGAVLNADRTEPVSGVSEVVHLLTYFMSTQPSRVDPTEGMLTAVHGAVSIPGPSRAAQKACSPCSHPQVSRQTVLIFVSV